MSSPDRHKQLEVVSFITRVKLERSALTNTSISTPNIPKEKYDRRSIAKGKPALYPETVLEAVRHCPPIGQLVSMVIHIGLVLLQ
jgi:hypothetical protein